MRRSNINRAASALVLALASAPASAAFVYEYTGLPFNLTQGNLWTVHVDFITVSFTVDAALTATSLTPIIPTAWVLGDNLTEIRKGNNDGFKFEVAVDAQGAIEFWDIQTWQNSGVDLAEGTFTQYKMITYYSDTTLGLIGSDRASYTACQLSGLPNCDAFNLIADGSIASYDVLPHGTWTRRETGVVPVPAAVWLFGSGLLGLIGVARRKVRS